MSNADYPEWLDHLDRQVDKIVDVVRKFPPELREKALERILDHTLSVAVRHPTNSLSSQDSGANPPQVGVLSSDATGAYSRFLTEFELSMTDIESVINVNTGEILARDLGKRGAEIQRHIAALLALANFARTGAFATSPDAIMMQSRRFSITDSANLAANIRRAEQGGLRVFQFENNEWHVTKSGEVYIADVVKAALGRPTSSSP
jgi:hypothetical protein